MRESNSRDWSHNPVPKPFGQSRHRQSGAGRVNRTLVGEVQALCTATVLDQQTLELARSLELRSGAYRASALPVELYQRSWRGDSNADHGLTRPALFLLSYTSTKLRRENLEAVGRIALPMICFAGRCLAVLATPPQTYLLTWSGRRDSNPRSRRWQRRVLATRRLPQKSWSEQRELNSRHRVGGPRHQPLYHARSWREMKDSNPRTWIWRPVS